MSNTKPIVSDEADHGIEYDEIVVNLKVIANIVMNAKLYTKGNLLNLEQRSVLPEFIRRWYRQDSRDESIKKIDRIITKAFTYHTPTISRYLTDAKTGILNMKDTYSSCVQTSARLDTIIDKIETYLSHIV